MVYDSKSVREIRNKVESLFRLRTTIIEKSQSLNKVGLARIKTEMGTEEDLAYKRQLEFSASETLNEIIHRFHYL
jgi:hypothetical protein